MTLQTLPETEKDTEGDADNCIHYWILPSHISLTSWQETCIKCSTVRQVVPNQQPKQRSAWQKTERSEPRRPQQTTTPKQEIKDHMNNINEGPVQHLVEPDDNATSASDSAPEEDQQHHDPAPALLHVHRPTKPENPTPTGQQVLKQLLDKGWTRATIANHSSLKKSYSLVGNWTTGKMPVPANHLDTLRELLNSEEDPPSSPPPPATASTPPPDEEISKDVNDTPQPSQTLGEKHHFHILDTNPDVNDEPQPSQTLGMHNPFHILNHNPDVNDDPQPLETEKQHNPFQISERNPDPSPNLLPNPEPEPGQNYNPWNDFVLVVSQT